MYMLLLFQDTQDIAYKITTSRVSNHIRILSIDRKWKFRNLTINFTDKLIHNVSVLTKKLKIYKKLIDTILVLKQYSFKLFNSSKYNELLVFFFNFCTDSFLESRKFSINELPVVCRPFGNDVKDTRKNLKIKIVNTHCLVRFA